MTTVLPRLRQLRQEINDELTLAIRERHVGCSVSRPRP